MLRSGAQAGLRSSFRLSSLPSRVEIAEIIGATRRQPDGVVAACAADAAAVSDGTQMLDNLAEDCYNRTNVLSRGAYDGPRSANREALT